MAASSGASDGLKLRCKLHCSRRRGEAVSPTRRPLRRPRLPRLRAERRVLGRRHGAPAAGAAGRKRAFPRLLGHFYGSRANPFSLPTATKNARLPRLLENARFRESCKMRVFVRGRENAHLRVAVAMPPRSAPIASRRLFPKKYIFFYKNTFFFLKKWIVALWLSRRHDGTATVQV